jgi:hypothetical protein
MQLVTIATGSRKICSYDSKKSHSKELELVSFTGSLAIVDLSVSRLPVRTNTLLHIQVKKFIGLDHSSDVETCPLVGSFR